MTLLLLLSRPLDRLKEEEEKEPIDEASDQPSVTTVNSDAKYGEDSKSTVAITYSRGCCWRGSPASNIQKKNHRAERFGVFLQLSDSSNRIRYIFLHFFFRFGYEILYIEFFCWICLDLILVLFPFCFGFLGSPWKS